MKRAKYRMRLAIAFALGCVMGILLSETPVLAIDDPSDLANSVPIRTQGAHVQEARMRYSIRITPYEKYLIKDQGSKVQHVFKPLATLNNNLRARIDQTSHFYIDKWHIESVPVSWKRDTQEISFQLKFYKLYGKHRTLEQFVGSTKVSGKLVGKDLLYELNGEQSTKFTNILGDPIIDITVSRPSQIGKGVASSGSKSTSEPAKGAL